MTATRLIVLGASGDLTGRYLLPALVELVHTDLLPEQVDLIGVARDEWDDEAFREFAAEQLGRHGDGLPTSGRDELIGRLRYQRGDAADATTLRAAVAGADEPILVYLALPPSVYASAITAVAEAGLPTGSRLVIEKPFGTDLASARELNRLLHEHFPESSAFRIDHFLGKQTVQNVLGLRFANRLFEPLWCNRHVERVDIVWEETVALEGRGGYYDDTGALRDMIQNHLLQLLCFLAMDRPDGLGDGPLRDAKVEVLRAVRQLDGDELRRHTSRARYRAGTIGDEEVPDYAAEPGVDPARQTETFADVTLFIDNDRWRGVPFRLLTGKAMAHDRREMIISFRPVDRLPFGQADEPGPNVLTLGMDPDRLAVDLALNGGGDPFCLDPARIEMQLAPQSLSAYARLLLDALEGDLTLAIRDDEAEECWRIVAPIVDAWARGEVPLDEYRAGSAGPR
jgi:glucose-6-phosphate 1-dehydrogenase